MRRKSLLIVKALHYLVSAQLLSLAHFASGSGAAGHSAEKWNC